MGSFLLAAGTKGKRFALPNSEILLHQPLVNGGIQGQASDIKIHAEHLIKTRSRINKIYSDMTGHPLEKIERDVERDFYMTASEAKAYGLIDELLVRNTSGK